MSCHADKKIPILLANFVRTADIIFFARLVVTLIFMCDVIFLYRTSV